MHDCGLLCAAFVEHGSVLLQVKPFQTPTDLHVHVGKY